MEDTTLMPIGNSNEIVIYQPDDTICLEVRMDNETVWLTQAQMVTLFQSSKANISEHIKSIYNQRNWKGSQLFGFSERFRKKVPVVYQEHWNIRCNGQKLGCF